MHWFEIVGIIYLAIGILCSLINVAYCLLDPETYSSLSGTPFSVKFFSFTLWVVILLLIITLWPAVLIKTYRDWQHKKNRKAVS